MFLFSVTLRMRFKYHPIAGRRRWVVIGRGDGFWVDTLHYAFDIENQ